MTTIPIFCKENVRLEMPAFAETNDQVDIKGFKSLLNYNHKALLTRHFFLMT